MSCCLRALFVPGVLQDRLSRTLNTFDSKAFALQVPASSAVPTYDDGHQSDGFPKWVMTAAQSDFYLRHDDWGDHRLRRTITRHDAVDFGGVKFRRAHNSSIVRDARLLTRRYDGAPDELWFGQMTGAYVHTQPAWLAAPEALPSRCLLHVEWFESCKVSTGLDRHTQLPVINGWMYEGRGRDRRPWQQFLDCGRVAPTHISVAPHPDVAAQRAGRMVVVHKDFRFWEKFT